MEKKVTGDVPTGQEDFKSNEERAKEEVKEGEAEQMPAGTESESGKQNGSGKVSNVPRNPFCVRFIPVWRSGYSPGHYAQRTCGCFWQGAAHGVEGGHPCFATEAAVDRHHQGSPCQEVAYRPGDVGQKVQA